MLTAAMKNLIFSPSPSPSPSLSPSPSPSPSPWNKSARRKKHLGLIKLRVLLMELEALESPGGKVFRSNPNESKV